MVIGGFKMRSKLTNVTGGIGTLLPWVEKEETYENKGTGLVKFPHDTKDSNEFDKTCEKLSGQVTTYFIESMVNIDE